MMNTIHHTITILDAPAWGLRYLARCDCGTTTGRYKSETACLWASMDHLAPADTVTVTIEDGRSTSLHTYYCEDCGETLVPVDVGTLCYYCDDHQHDV